MIIRARRDVSTAEGGDHAAKLACICTLATWHSGPLHPMACRLSGLRDALVMFHHLFCMRSHHVHVPLLVISWYALVVKAGAIIMLQLLVCMCGGGRCGEGMWAEYVVPPSMLVFSVQGALITLRTLAFAYVLVLADIIPARVCHQHAFVQS
jgi:hypothetical protein